MIEHNHIRITLSTNEVAISKAYIGLSIGSKCPALFTILSSSSPALFIDPTTLLLIFQGVNNFLRNYSD